MLKSNVIFVMKVPLINLLVVSLIFKISTVHGIRRKAGGGRGGQRNYVTITRGEVANTIQISDNLLMQQQYDILPTSPACNCIDWIQLVIPSRTYILLLLLGQNRN